MAMIRANEKMSEKPWSDVLVDGQKELQIVDVISLTVLTYMYNVRLCTWLQWSCIRYLCDNNRVETLRTVLALDQPQKTTGQPLYQYVHSYVTK